MSGSRGLCPFCKGEIEVPQVTVAVKSGSVIGAMPTSPPIVFAEIPQSPLPTLGNEATIYSDSDVTVTAARVMLAGPGFRPCETSHR